jgi:hypothetical protein
MKIVLQPKDNRPAITLTVTASPTTAATEIDSFFKSFAPLISQMTPYRITKITEN